MTQPAVDDLQPHRVAVTVFLTVPAVDQRDADIRGRDVVRAALKGRATVDGRHLTAHPGIRHVLHAEVAEVEPTGWAFDNGYLKVTPGWEPYRYLGVNEEGT